MRTIVFLLLFLALATVSARVLLGMSGTTSSYAMAELDAPASVQQPNTTLRPDLHRPTPRPAEYAVPTDLRGRATSHVTEGTAWNAYIPDSAPVGPAPVVILFHGARRDPLSLVDMWRETAERNGIVLIAVAAPNGLWPRDSLDVASLHRILARMAELRPVDLDRVYLFGHSNGAVYVQLLLNLTNGPWRAAAVHGGYVSSATAIIPADPKPIRFYLGTLERAAPIDRIDAIAEGLAARGHLVDIQLIENNTHWFYESGPLIAEDAWLWFEPR